MRRIGKFATLAVLAVAWLAGLKCGASAILLTSLVWGLES